MILRPPLFTLFPYTTLFRSRLDLVRMPDLKNAVWQFPPAGLRHEPETRLVILLASASFAAAPTAATSFCGAAISVRVRMRTDRKSTRLNSSHGYISYAVFCL